VFSSKAFSAYTQLMIAHVDEEGYSAPPVLLDRMTVSNRAANIPEFVNAEPAAISRIVTNFVDDNSLYRAGLEYSRGNDPTRAEAMYRKSLEMNPDNKAAHVMLGALLGDRGEYDEALFHFREAIRIDPLLMEAHSNMGYVLMWKGDDGGAFGCFTRAVRLNSRMIEAHLGLGVLRLKSGEYDLAENRFRIALNIDQYNISAGIGLAKALRHQGKREQALDVIMNVVRTAPGDIEALLETGELLAELKQYDEAMLHFNKVLGLDPGNMRALKGIDLVNRFS
jgi:tetratricopeptide (TPR) repeat protein